MPSNLLVARARRGRIEPLLLEPSGLPVALASEVLELFERGVGKGRRELEEGLADLEELALELGLDLRVVRAMFTLAARHARFEPPKAPVDPVKARMEVFEEACREFGVAVTEEERSTVLRRVAERLGCSVEDLESVLGGYLEEVLAEPPALKAEDLVRMLNLSMVQTLLFKASQLEVVFRSDGATAKKLLRAVKRLGLLYVAEQLGEGVRLTVDGPASLLRQTRRYGTRLAKLVPLVMLAERWRIRARVPARGRDLFFELGDEKSGLFPRVEEEPEPLFDSEVEREFYRSISSLARGWRVEREPEPLVAGNKVLIPDFSVSNGERKVYIEILGFWTKDYLERKMQKLRELRGVNIVVAVNEELACSSVKDLPHDVVVFKGRLRGADVYPVLKRYLGEPPEEPREEVEYRLEGLPDLSGRTLSEAIRELRKLGVPESEAVKVLEKLGYGVDWTTLDPDKLVLKKNKRR